MASNVTTIYVGTYTGAGSRGIHRLELDVANGTLASKGGGAETENPSFLLLHPSRPYLYAVNETGEGPQDPSGGVSAFAVDPNDGRLTALGRQPSEGAAPCHLAIDRSGEHLLVANYAGGSVAVLPIGPDGRLGRASSVVRHEGRSVHPERQREPHPHSVNPDPSGTHAYVCDLGIDAIVAYRFDAARGVFQRDDTAGVRATAGAGPRHLAFDPARGQLYVINELDCTVTRYAVDARARRLEPRQPLSTLPSGTKVANTAAEVALHPNGRLLYASNRGDNSIAIFAIAADGALAARGHAKTGGKGPRHFAIDPTGTFLVAANEKSDTVVPFRIESETGALTKSGDPVAISRPTCVRFRP